MIFDQKKVSDNWQNLAIAGRSFGAGRPQGSSAEGNQCFEGNEGAAERRPDDLTA